MYHGPLFFGTNQQEFDVVYDTGSDWVVIDGKSCKNCEGNFYDPSQSTTAKNLGNPVSVRAYGSAILYGTEWTDKVCLKTMQACIDDFEYF
jgi:hypothetical protein